MSIESDFAQFRVHLSRIADALEALLAERGYVPTSPTSVDDKAETPAPAAKKKSKKKTGKKNKGETMVGTPDVDEPSIYTLPDVRKVLKKLQEKTNQAAVKSLLKKYGASTLTQVKEKHYVDIIRDAEEDLE